MTIILILFKVITLIKIKTINTLIKLFKVYKNN